MDGIISLCERTYPSAPPYEARQLASQSAAFPHGQFVVEIDGELVAMSSALLVRSSDYPVESCWDVITRRGWIGNHDPRGDILYGVEFMVASHARRHGLGRRMHAARVELIRELGVSRIRAGIRLASFHAARGLTPERYVEQVLAGTLNDPVLSFHVDLGFELLAVARHYVRDDPESRGCAAIMEWKTRGPDPDPKR